MIWTRELQFAFFISMLGTICTLWGSRHEIYCLKEAISFYQSAILCMDGNLNSSCSPYCNSSPVSSFDNGCKGQPGETAEIVIKLLNINETLTFSSTGKAALQISCEFSGKYFCNGSSNANKSLSECQTTQNTVISTGAETTKYLTSDPSTKTEEMSREKTEAATTAFVPIITNSIITPFITTAIQDTTNSNVTFTIKNVSEAHDQARCQVCSENSGSIIGAVFIGLIVGAVTTGFIFIFLKRRKEQPAKNRTVLHRTNDINRRQASVTVTAGVTYNEIENISQSPRISYVSPITKDQPESSIATNNPEIYHHLRQDYDVKDRSNYYDHAVPLNGPQNTESDHYGKLATEENGAYSTVTNSTITEPEIVRNEAYSTIETNEFQLVELEGNVKDNVANYFVLAKE